MNERQVTKCRCILPSAAWRQHASEVPIQCQEQGRALPALPQWVTRPGDKHVLLPVLDTQYHPSVQECGHTAVVNSHFSVCASPLHPSSLSQPATEGTHVPASCCGGASCPLCPWGGRQDEGRWGIHTPLWGSGNPHPPLSGHLRLMCSFYTVALV